MASAGVQGFFKQKKKGAGVTKPSISKKKAPAKSTVGRSPGSVGIASLPTVVSHDLRDEEKLGDVKEEDMEVLRQFDMDMRYGPCIGLSRLERWNRAYSIGLQPPDNVSTILRSRVSAAASPSSCSSAASALGLDCLWEGRI